MKKNPKKEDQEYEYWPGIFFYKKSNIFYNVWESCDCGEKNKNITQCNSVWNWPNGKQQTCT